MAWRLQDENIIKTSSMKNRCIDVISKKGGITIEILFYLVLNNFVCQNTEIYEYFLGLSQ